MKSNISLSELIEAFELGKEEDLNLTDEELALLYVIWETGDSSLSEYLELVNGEMVHLYSNYSIFTDLQIKEFVDEDIRDCLYEIKLELKRMNVSFIIDYFDSEKYSSDHYDEFYNNFYLRYKYIGECKDFKIFKPY